MSDKYVSRRSLIAKLIGPDTYCQACLVWAGVDLINNKRDSALVQHNKAKDLHELINRSQGGSILDEANIIVVCRPCHTRITVNPKDAELVGLHLESWCNSSSHFSEAERLRNAWSSGVAAVPYWWEQGK